MKLLASYIKLILAITLLGTSLSAEVNLPEAPSINYRSMGEYAKKTVIEFKGEPVNLKETTYLAADKVIFSTQVITNGHELRIDTKELVFNKSKNGSIIGFEDAASTGAVGFKGPLVTRGKQGSDGLKGQDGENGMKAPGPIIIFAESIKGKVNINASGQQGGQGGQGGSGARGGKGADGRDAKTNCRGRDRFGKNGARGLMGGLGGQGGNGGLGGAAVPVILITNELKPLGLKGVIATPGLGGLAGEPGYPGPPGDGGDGGLAEGHLSR